jgi:Uma2 family endonuclease
MASRAGGIGTVMAAPKRRATYEDLMQVPDTKIAEIVDGELIVSPRPASPHAYAAAAIGSLVQAAYHGDGDAADPRRPGGWWILAEPELHLGEDVIVPDFAGWRRERMPVFPAVPFFTLAPDWVGEIISPSTGRIDRSRKMRIYAREHVRHLWLVEPQVATLEVYRLNDAGLWTVAGVWGGDEQAFAEPFDDLELQLVRWWLPASIAAP